MIQNFTMYLVLMLFGLVCTNMSENIWEYLIMMIVGVGTAGLLTYFNCRDANDKKNFLNQ